MILVIKRNPTKVLQLVNRAFNFPASSHLNCPSLIHSWQRRWEVWYGTNLSGKSYHRAPERRIHSVLSITSRSLRSDLPCVVGADGLLNNGSAKDHRHRLILRVVMLMKLFKLLFEMASSRSKKYEHQVSCHLVGKLTKMNIISNFARF